jgi:AcrR family transcriptional regulator
MSNYSFYIIIMSSKKFSRNKQEKIDLIYETFFDLILKQGYHKVSTNHVAKSAKISIGTIYKYFPKGKDDIMRKYFEESMETVIDKEALLNINNNNIRDFIYQFIKVLYQFHKEKKGYNLAFRSIIQSNKTLRDLQKEKLFTSFKELAQELRKQNESFEKIPEKKLIEIFFLLYNLINAILYHHLSVMEFFDTDDKLIEFLSTLVICTLGGFT